MKISLKDMTDFRNLSCLKHKLIKFNKNMKKFGEKRDFIIAEKIREEFRLVFNYFKNAFFRKVCYYRTV
jgi:hypothetical protein